MKNTSTLLLQKNISKVFPNKIAATVIEGLLLFFLGVLAITLHAKLRIPMHLPGKHGVLFMFIIMAGIASSRFRHAALISCAGAATMIFTNSLGFNDPFLGAIYLLVGFVLDLLLFSSVKFNQAWWLLAISGGVAYSMIPLTRFIVSILTGIPYPSLATGVFYPFALHFLFGLAGSLLALGLINIFRNKE